jgi:hypothetical protein
MEKNLNKTPNCDIKNEKKASSKTKPTTLTERKYNDDILRSCHLKRTTLSRFACCVFQLFQMKRWFQVS